MSTRLRRHDVDAIRVLAFASLIVYHCAMAYVADWGWHVKSSYTAVWLQEPMLFINRWRMELLFLISGVALAFLRRGGSPGALAWLRSKRLLLPLLFGTAVVVPLQPYCQGVSNGLVEPGFGRFLLRYWGGGPWPANAFDGWQLGWTWNHLWYLAYLWVYSLIVLALPALGRLRLPLRLRGSALLFLPPLPLTLAAVALQDRFPGTNDLVHDWFMHAVYFSFFLYGCWLGEDQGLWRELLRLRRSTLIWALAFFCVYRLLSALMPDDAGALLWAPLRWVRWNYTWLAIAAVLGWGQRYLNRPFPWLSYASEAVFPWYVLHQTLIIGLVYRLAPLRLGPLLEPLLVFCGTVAGCALLHEVIRRIGWLRPLFGLKPRLTPGAAAPAPQAVGQT